MSLLLSNKRRRFNAVANPDPNFSNVVLYLKGDGSDDSTSIIDSSNSGKTVTANGNVKIKTNISKYGGSSINFPGNSGHLAFTANSDFTMGTGNFTYEGYLYINAVTGTHIIFCTNDIGDYISLLQVDNDLGDPFLRFTFGNTPSLLFTFDFPLNTWFHFAITRNSNDYKMFVNGSQKASNNVSGLNGSDNNFRMGRRINFGTYGDGFFNGNIDSFRITKGIARYTANFNPDTDTYLAY